MIVIRDLVKSFGPVRILDGASLVARPGELTALVGPSGGGKSTLLRCINGLETFETGTIEAFGHILVGGQHPPPALLQKLRQAVGMVFQQFNLFPHMTALQNVMSGPVYALGKPKAEAAAKAEQLLERVGLKERMHAKPGNLSGGQQQRVAIARALAVEPTAILFDEPTSALDPQMVREVLAVMTDLAASGQTMIVVTHDTDFARSAAVVHKMVAGKVAASGTPEEVLS